MSSHPSSIALPSPRIPSAQSPLVRYRTIQPNERVWADNYDWLVKQGYALRRRYHPDWQPSWKKTVKEYKAFDYEDLQRDNLNSHLLDATRISDGSFMKLKLISYDEHPEEVDIGTFLSTEPLASDPRNRCVRIHEVLKLPDSSNRVLLVMPLLLAYNFVRLDTFGEAVDMFRQLFEGLQFMHEHGVAHRDISGLNVMMDATAMAKKPWHPVRPRRTRDFAGTTTFRTRTECPPKYYFTDFGISRRYDPGDPAPLATPWIGGDRTVPEFQNLDRECNPFYTDVYYMGNFVRANFMNGGPLHPGYLGFDFMEPLIRDMVQDDPEKRPSMKEVVNRFADIVRHLSPWKLRSRVVQRDDHAFLGFFRAIAHSVRRIKFITTRVPAIPQTC